MHKKIFVTLMTSLLSCTAAFSFWPEAADSSFELGVGYRNDSFKWETRADTTGPFGPDGAIIPVELKSVLHWKNLNIWQIQAKGKYVTCDNIYLRAAFDYGWITSGKVRDSDYIRALDGSSSSSCSDFSGSGSESGNEFSRSNNRAKGGHVYDADVAVGYQFQLCDDSLALAPVLGYAWNGQHLEIKRGRQSIPFSTTIEGLHSHYKARWNGPFLGVDLDYRFSCDWALFASYEFHWARYHASARWNLRDDLVDGKFNHRAKNGYGNVVALGVKWDFCECWTVSLSGKYQYWTAKHGKDKAKVAELSVGSDIDIECYLTSPVRRIEWTSGSVMVDLGMVF